MAKGFHIGVEVVNPKAHVSGPFFDLSTQSIDIQIGVTLDANGENPIVADLVVSSDSQFVFGLAYTDESLSSDSHFTDVQTPIADQADSADAVVTNVDAPLSDATSNTDSEMGFGFQHSDAESATDLAAVDVETSASDLAESVDQAHTNVESAASDTTQSSDSGVGYIQDYIDDYFEPDYIGREFSF
ncbi:MAG: hypothetical protein CML16_03030 [Pusillimonas sp.]|nr:hypothetical protein [Pusillimonas sp.]MBC43561.1 hypothetical protein [Pusillimonas sp.]HCP78938.1 hypothetical protein [Pusillimonas sp.]|tara:strand:- start:229 stop:789 length:561 start_codon:yes stop_codon:yes gene_type:complete